MSLANDSKNVQSQNFQTLKSPRLDSKGSIPAAYEAMASRYDSPIPTWFLAPIDCLIIPALYKNSPVTLPDLHS